MYKLHDEFICFRESKIYECLNGEELTALRQILFKILKASPEKYLCIDKNKPYIEEIENVIKQHEQKEIIAFIGRAGSGKDYQCKLLEEKGFKKLAFADALRDIAFSSLGLNTDVCIKNYDWFKANKCITVKTEYNNLDIEVSEGKLNFREFLEYLGTEGIRKYDNAFWVKCLIKTLEENKYKKVCISDMRFFNEYFMLYDWAEKNDYKMRVIFCDYHSSRYQTNNSHDSARLGNWFAEHGYNDLQEISYGDFLTCKQDMKRYGRR